jgi:hypothetical protein
MVFQKKDNCSQAIKAAHKHGLIDSSKKEQFEKVNKLGNLANHNFVDPLPKKK